MINSRHMENINIIPSIIIGVGDVGSRIAYNIHNFISDNLSDASILINCMGIDISSKGDSHLPQSNDDKHFRMFYLDTEGNASGNRSSIYKSLEDNLNAIWPEVYKLISKSSFVGNLDSVRSKGYNPITDEFNVILVGSADDILTQSSLNTLSYFISDKVKSEQGIAGVRTIGFLSIGHVKIPKSAKEKESTNDSRIKDSVRELAFLRELNHFMSGNEFQFNKDYFYIKTRNRVFDMLFIMDNINQNNEILAQTPAEYETILSNAIFYNILNADKNRSRLLSTVTKYGKRSAVFSTLGLASSKCPIKDLSSLYTYRLSSELLSKITGSVAKENPEDLQPFSMEYLDAKSLYNKSIDTFEERIKKRLLSIPSHSLSLKRILSYKPVDVPGVDELMRGIKKAIEKKFSQFDTKVHSFTEEVLNKTPNKLNALIALLGLQLRSISENRDVLAELEEKETSKTANIKESIAELKSMANISETIFPPIGWLVLIGTTALLLLIASFKAINMLQSYGYLILDFIMLISSVAWAYYMYVLSISAEDGIRSTILDHFITKILSPFARIKTIEHLNERLDVLRGNISSQKDTFEELGMRIQEVKKEFDNKKNDKEEYLKKSSFTLIIRNVYPYGALYKAYEKIVKDIDQEWIAFTKEFDVSALTKLDQKTMFEEIYQYSYKKFLELKELCAVENIMSSQTGEDGKPLISLAELENKSSVWLKYNTTAPGGKITPEMLRYLYVYSGSSTSAKEFKANSYGNRYVVATGDKFSIGISTVHHGLPLFSLTTVSKLMEIVKKFGQNAEPDTLFADEEQFEPIEATTISKDLEDTIQNFLLALVTGDIVQKDGQYALKYKRKTFKLGNLWKESISLIMADKKLSQKLDDAVGKSLRSFNEKTLYESLTSMLDANKEQMDKTISIVAKSLLLNIGSD